MRDTTVDSVALHPKKVSFMVRLGNSLALGSLVCVAVGLFSGCNSVAGPTVPVPGTTSSVTTDASSTSSSTPAHITEPSVYVVDDTWSTRTIVRVFPKSATGDTPGTLSIPGTMVSVDDAGNIYVVGYGAIIEYPAGSPSDPPVRTIPVGPGKKILSVQDVVANSTGEIFVSDRQGIAVFRPGTGNADVDPDRYIRGVTQSAGGMSTPIKPGLIAVDRSDNLYVQNLVDGSIAVFGPNDTGTVAPVRTTTGPLNNRAGLAGFSLFEDCCALATPDRAPIQTRRFV